MSTTHPLAPTAAGNDVVPSTSWLESIADWIDGEASRDASDIARELRAHAARLTPEAIAESGFAELPPAGWVAQLAEWMCADPRAGADELARQVETWARQLARPQHRVIRL